MISLWFSTSLNYGTLFNCNMTQSYTLLPSGDISRQLLLWTYALELQFFCEDSYICTKVAILIELEFALSDAVTCLLAIIFFDDDW